MSDFKNLDWKKIVDDAGSLEEQLESLSDNVVVDITPGYEGTQGYSIVLDGSNYSSYKNASERLRDIVKSKAKDNYRRPKNDREKQKCSEEYKEATEVSVRQMEEFADSLLVDSGYTQDEYGDWYDPYGRPCDNRGNRT
jgi:hypothetical protein